MRPLIKLWRGKGLKAIIYLDDGIVSVKGSIKLGRLAPRLEVIWRMQAHRENSWGVPSQVIGWLGFRIDLAEGMFSVPSENLDALWQISA